MKSSLNITNGVNGMYFESEIVMIGVNHREMITNEVK